MTETVNRGAANMAGLPVFAQLFTGMREGIGYSITHDLPCQHRIYKTCAHKDQTECFSLHPDIYHRDLLLLELASQPPVYS